MKHEKYKKHNIKINKENYEVIINIRIDKQIIDVRGSIEVAVNIEMR